jgi:O-antigen ligase
MPKLQMARHHWLGGVGIGAFEVAYPEYQTFKSDLVIDYAHNDYAQLLAEGGVVGFAMAGTAILLFVFSARRHLRSRAAGQSEWLQLGATVAIFGVLIHSFTDFNLHIPANAAWMAFALGISTLPPGDSPVLGKGPQR